MTAPADAEPREVLRAIPFLPSGRDDCIATARMSFEDYLRLDYESGLAEWVDGEVRLYMSNTNEHQRIVDFLVSLLSFYFRVSGGGIVRSAPYAMQAASGAAGREPDLTVVREEHRDRLGSTHLVGLPDAVFEVVSEESVRRDRVEKLAEYAAAGIPEYWVLDSRPGREQADLYVLDQGDYVAVAMVGGALHSREIPGFWLRPEWLRTEEPDPAAALEAILGRKLF